MGRIVAISCCIRILGITTTNLHDLEWTALLAPVLKHVNCVGKSADEGRGDASSASCRHPAGAVLFRKDPWPSQACPCQELSSSAGPVEIAQGREPPGRAGRMQRFALAARLRADDPQHLFPVVLAEKMQAASGPAGPLIRKDRDEAGGSAGDLLRSIVPSSSARSQNRSHTRCSQTARPLTATSRSVPSISPLHWAQVRSVRDVVGCWAVRGGVFGGIRFFFSRPKTPLQTRHTRHNNVFNGLARILNPTQRGLVSGWILAKSPLFSTLCRVCRVQKPDSGPQKNRTLFRSRLRAGDSA